MNESRPEKPYREEFLHLLGQIVGLAYHLVSDGPPPNCLHPLRQNLSTKPPSRPAVSAYQQNAEQRGLSPRASQS